MISLNHVKNPKYFSCSRSECLNMAGTILIVENKARLARCPNVVSLSDHTVVNKTAICRLQMLRLQSERRRREASGEVSGAGTVRGLMGSPQPLVEVSTTWERVTHTHLWRRCVCVWAVSCSMNPAELHQHNTLAFCFPPTHRSCFTHLFCLVLVYDFSSSSKGLGC